MAKIFIFTGPGNFDDERLGYALAEDGRLIITHMFPSDERARARMEP